jgi:hypothetical protein
MAVINSCACDPRMIGFGLRCDIESSMRGAVSEEESESQDEDEM